MFLSALLTNSLLAKMAAMEGKDSEAKVAGPSQQTASASTGDSELDQKVAEWLALDQVNTSIVNQNNVYPKHRIWANSRA